MTAEFQALEFGWKPVGRKLKRDVLTKANVIRYS